jgi:hypothetical protein
MAKSKKKITGRGGAGRGQGPKFKYGEPTKLMRIPISLVPEVEKLIQSKSKAS